MPSQPIETKEAFSSDSACDRKRLPAAGSNYIRAAYGVSRSQDLWPKFAEIFGSALAEPTSISPQAAMADQASVWDRIVQVHCLEPHALEHLVSWRFENNAFKTEHDVISSTTKARPAGFHEARNRWERCRDCSRNSGNRNSFLEDRSLRIVPVPAYRSTYRYHNLS